MLFPWSTSRSSLALPSFRDNTGFVGHSAIVGRRRRGRTRRRGSMPPPPGRSGTYPAGHRRPSTGTATDRGPASSFSSMRQTRPTRLAALALLSLVLGVPGIVWVHCPACEAMEAPQASGCHGDSGLKLLPEHCGGQAAILADLCCGRLETPAPSSGTTATTAPAAPSLALAPMAAAPAIPLWQEPANPPRLADEPPLHEGTGLFVLLSVFRI